MFLISNWLDTSYSALRPSGLGVTRETFHIVSKEPPDQRHRESTYRPRVHEFLQAGNMLGYNNGDPALYNPAANGLFSMFAELARRGKLSNSDALETCAALARTPVEIVARAHRSSCRKGQRLVAGMTHELAITPNGAYESSTGD